MEATELGDLLREDKMVTKKEDDDEVVLQALKTRQDTQTRAACLRLRF